MEIGTFNPLMDQSLVEGVLIAAWFHDLGMARSTREEHGIMGRENCAAYFKEHALDPPSRFDEILMAIEAHDNKEEITGTVIQPGEPPGILEIISIADDLEAMGIIGIYRYTEIYLKRNIALVNLGGRIIENASIRYRNFSMCCIHCPTLIEDYGQQYTRLVSFFNHYNQQLLREPHPDNVWREHLGIINYIRIMSVEGSTRPEDFVRIIGMDNPGTIVNQYFTSLNNELLQARL